MTITISNKALGGLVDKEQPILCKSPSLKVTMMNILATTKSGSRGVPQVAHTMHDNETNYS